MTKDYKFILFLLISILLHILLFFTIKENTLFKNNKIVTIKKNEPTKIRFIDLPDNTPETKKKVKSKFIAQKSHLAKKQTRKNTPLIKSKPKIPQKKSIVVTEKIPTLYNNKVVAKKQQKQRKRKVTKPKKIVKKKIVKKIVKKKVKTAKIRKKVIRKKIVKKKTVIALNKITPNYKEILEKGLFTPEKRVKSNKKTEKSKKSNKQPNKEFKESDVKTLSPNIFQPSHIYPDDIDISDSVSISTQSSRFASYLHKVKRKIELVWEYPPLAGEMGIGGRVFVKFTINKYGHLVNVKLLKSSGAAILDKEAIKAIKEAADYPPFPKDNSFGVNEIKIHACFDYVIVGKEIW